MLSEQLAQASFADFFVVIGVSIGIGLIMGFNGDRTTFVIGMTVCMTSAITAFLIFIIPKFSRLFKKQPPIKSLGEYLARGENREIPALSMETKIKLVDVQF
jgi:multisubunit Na+/H+ antiporter MnhC subunit